MSVARAVRDFISSSDTDVCEIVQAPSILNQICGEYPGIGKLMRHNLEGTLGLLTELRAITLKRFHQQVFRHHKGEDNIKTWADYRVNIERYLHELDDDEHLHQGRLAVARVIHDEHFIAFPLWPRVGEEQGTEVTLNSQGNYTQLLFKIFWSVVGYVYVKDTRPKPCDYRTQFEGRPDMKVVKVNTQRMRSLNLMAKKSPQEMIDLVDEQFAKMFLGL